MKKNKTYKGFDKDLKSRGYKMISWLQNEDN